MTTYEAFPESGRTAARSAQRAGGVGIAVEWLMVAAAALLSQTAAVAGGTGGLPTLSLAAFAILAVSFLHAVRVLSGAHGAASPALAVLGVPLATGAAGSVLLLTAAAAHADASTDVARIWLFATLYVLAGRYVVASLPATIGRDLADVLDAGAKRALDVASAVLLLLVFAPLFAAVAVAIKLDSPGPVFYRCRRIGRNGRELDMLKFRKMWDGASGLPLTASSDHRLTRVGRVITDLKLDELPQLWNVVRGDMSLVGPRPEDPAFVREHWESFQPILEVRPGITGLCQLAFAKEAQILDPEDRMRDYVERLLPQKIRIDLLYASRRTFAFDLQIALWTVAAVVLRRDVAVNRRTGELTIRRRRATPASAPG